MSLPIETTKISIANTTTLIPIASNPTLLTIVTTILTLNASDAHQEPSKNEESQQKCLNKLGKSSKKKPKTNITTSLPLKNVVGSTSTTCTFVQAKAFVMPSRVTFFYPNLGMDRLVILMCDDI